MNRIYYNYPYNSYYNNSYNVGYINCNSCPVARYSVPASNNVCYNQENRLVYENYGRSLYLNVYGDNDYENRHRNRHRHRRRHDRRHEHRNRHGWCSTCN